MIRDPQLLEYINGPESPLKKAAMLADWLNRKDYEIQNDVLIPSDRIDECARLKSRSIIIPNSTSDSKKEEHLLAVIARAENAETIIAAVNAIGIRECREAFLRRFILHWSMNQLCRVGHYSRQSGYHLLMFAAELFLEAL